MAAHDGEVLLVDRLQLEALCECARNLALEREQQHARGAAVQPVGGIHALADLVAQQLHCETRLVRRNRAAMHEQARGLVDRDQRRVAVEDVEHGASRRWRAACSAQGAGKRESDHVGRFRIRRGRLDAGSGNQAKFFAAKSQFTSLSRKVATKSGRRLR